MMHKRPGSRFALLVLVLAAGCLVGHPRRRSAPEAPAPAVVVNAAYPGANCQVVADTVAAPIEQQVNGVEKMRHMVSRCTNDGNYTLTATFEDGVDLDQARRLVRNRVDLAMPILPDLVKQTGVAVEKGPANVRLLVSVSSPDGSRDMISLGRYATLVQQEELSRLSGVAEVRSLGQREYGVRIWIDALKLASRKLTAKDVVRALEARKARVKPVPGGEGEVARLDLTDLGRLADLDQLDKIILTTGRGKPDVRLHDVARIELGASGPERFAYLDGKPVAVLAVYPARQADAEKLSAAVRGLVKKPRHKAPGGMALDLAFDFTPNLESPGRATTPDYLLLDVDMPAGASFQRTAAVLKQYSGLVRKVEGVRSVLALTENPFDGRGRPCLLVRLDAPADRKAGRQQVVGAVRACLREVEGVGVRVRDLTGRFPRCGYPIDLAVSGPEWPDVRKFAKKLGERLRQDRQLADVWVDPASTPHPQIQADIDRARLKDRGVAVNDVLTTLQTCLGDCYVNDFNKFGRTWQVIVPTGGESRANFDNLKRLKLRNGKGEMVAVGDVANLRLVEGPAALDLLDGRPMVEITANLAVGTSAAQARKLCDALAAEVRKELKLSDQYRLTWLRDPPAPK